MIHAAMDARLGSDPVQRETKSGKPMVTASLAVDVARAGDEPALEWVSIVAFGALGGALARHVKGDVISVMGTLTRSSFTGRDGEQRSSWSLLAESVLSTRTVRNERPRARRHSSPLPVRASRPSFDTAPLPRERA